MLPLSESFKNLNDGPSKEQLFKALVDVVRTYRKQLMTEIEQTTVCNSCGEPKDGYRPVDEALIVMGQKYEDTLVQEHYLAGDADLPN